MARTLIKTKNYSLEMMNAKLPRRMRKRVTYVRMHCNIIAVLPVLDRGRVVLLQEYRPLLKNYVYSVITGKTKRGESYAAAAAREMGEEAGYRAESLKLLFKCYISPAFIKQNAVRVFLAEGLREAKRHPDKDELIKVRVMSLDKAMRLVKEGRVPDPLGVAAFLYYVNFMRRRSL
ncbi:MAG: NUDIX hydrolase [Candidatus Marsarchaeota archaeon]|jgi:ADP-ribose pyrophosphatase|nr:NUDIX hydrolase [Candidatus Marsarchaeota archaeon]MCL5111542.1 NUDIX hydrolase [Candidatus Marsarchaeota archaeon]